MNNYNMNIFTNIKKDKYMCVSNCANNLIFNHKPQNNINTQLNINTRNYRSTYQ